MDGGKVTGLLFVDISKEFDSLNHKNLLGKLESLGWSSRPLRWFQSHLADRRQRVLIFFNASLYLQTSQSITKQNIK